MLKYAKIVNQETKQCDVGLGTNENFYISQGFTKQEVEQDYKGNWYLQGYAPEKTLEELKAEKIEELKKERDIYKSKTFIRDGYSLLDFEPFTCYNYHNLVRLKCGWTQKDLDKFDAENEFISKFWDTKKEEIKNSTAKTKIKNIETKFIKK